MTVLNYNEPVINTKWEYSGEYIQSCQECGKDIHDGDIVSYVGWTYKDNEGVEIWHHPECWEKGEFVTNE